MTYNNIEDAYRKEFQNLLSAAKKQLSNQDYAIDCVHDAFEKALEYLSKHPGRKISGFLLLREVTRSAKKNNKRAGIQLVEYQDGTEPNNDRFAE